MVGAGHHVRRKQDHDRSLGVALTPRERGEPCVDRVDPQIASRHTLRSHVPAALCFWQRSKHVHVLLVRTRGQRYLQLVRFSKQRGAKSRFLFSDCRKIDLDCAEGIELRQVAKDVRDNLVVLACTPVGLRKRDAWKMRGGCLTTFLLVHQPVLSELTMSGAVNHPAMLFKLDVAQT